MTTPEAEALAKKRYMALSLVRMSGAALVLVGLLFALDKVEIAQPPRHFIGVVMIVLGMADFFVMPKILANRWKSPDA